MQELQIQNSPAGLLQALQSTIELGTLIIYLINTPAQLADLRDQSTIISQDPGNSIGIILGAAVQPSIAHQV